MDLDEMDNWFLSRRAWCQCTDVSKLSEVYQTQLQRNPTEVYCEHGPQLDKFYRADGAYYLEVETKARENDAAL